MKLSEMSDNQLHILLGYVFGFSLLGVYFILALVIALGKVEEVSSHGLREIVAAIGPLGGLFCGWAFGKSQSIATTNDKPGT